MSGTHVRWVEYDKDGPKCRVDHELGRYFVKPDLTPMRVDREFTLQNYNDALDMMALAAEMLVQAKMRANAALRTRKILSPRQRFQMVAVKGVSDWFYKKALETIEGRAQE